MKKISVVSGTYNEQENVSKLYKEVKEVFEGFKEYHYEHIFIDNCSTDKTVDILRNIAEKDKNVKIIVNSRNFGHVRSSSYAIMQASGDAVISLASDLQEPPYLIKNFIEEWNKGYKIVVGIKSSSTENKILFFLRKMYYKILNLISDTKQLKNFTGFGLFDKQVINEIKKMADPYPYFRGLVQEVGFEVATIEYSQSKRTGGKTKNNLYTLFDMAMLGFVNHSKIPLRLATLIGMVCSLVCFLIGLGYLFYKLLFWERFQLGMAPLIIGFFLFSSVQLFFIGILGEYIGAVYTQVRKRPLVVEKERINF